MNHKTQSPSADALAAAAKAAGVKGLPPVHLWNPPFCGDIDMRIAANGQWFYQGSPIGRETLVKLFSSILKREGDRYFLVTPAEKVGIIVEDAPLFCEDFCAAGMEKDQVLTFSTRTEDSVQAGPAHPLRFEINPTSGDVSPYILIRNGLWAKIDRKSFFRMVDLACHETQAGDSWFGLWSLGQFFAMLPSSDLSS